MSEERLSPGTGRTRDVPACHREKTNLHIRIPLSVKPIEGPDRSQLPIDRPFGLMASAEVSVLQFNQTKGCIAAQAGTMAR
jgi:hypothetical protein